MVIAPSAGGNHCQGSPHFARRRFPDMIMASRECGRTTERQAEEAIMPRIVRGGLIQAKLCEPATAPVARIKQAMTEKHLQLIAAAADRGAQVICLQELFNGPYFCAEQQPKWYALTERIPDGPTIKLMCERAKKHGI